MRPSNGAQWAQSASRCAASYRKPAFGRIGVGRVLLLSLVCLFVSAAGRSQQRLGGKLPGIGKSTPSGSTQQAFTGSVQSLDKQHHVLNISTSQSGSTEIFPIQKKVKISSVRGRKLKLAALTPGTNVVVYYQEKEGRRTVNQIVVLSSGTTPSSKKKTPASS